MKNFADLDGRQYPLTQLVVSHPDVDHIKNIEKVHTKFTPYLLHRTYIEEFPLEVVHNEDESYQYYRDKVHATYTGTNPQTPDWGFVSKVYTIPMTTLKTDASFGESKLKNNSSIVYLLQYGSFRILFCGDLEEAGWDWLIDNNHLGFKDEMSKGVDVIVASHHGHTSGYSQKLMDLIGSPKLSILSKGSETGEETDVDGRYSANSAGLSVTGLTLKNIATKKTLTTRSNGSIYIQVNAFGAPTIWADTI